MSSFLILLFDKGRIGFLRSINDFYQKFADELKGVVRASLISATELSPDAVEKIRTTLSERTGKDVILEIDVQGGLQIREKFPDAKLIFFKAPNDEILEQRLRGRGTDSDEVIA